MKALYNLAKRCNSYYEFERILNSNKNINILDTVNNILKNTEYTLNDIISRNRKRDLSDFRMILSYILITMRYSNQEISKILKRHRTSILHHYNTVKALLTNKDYKEKFNLIYNNYKNNTMEKLELTQEEQDEFDIETELFNEWLNGDGLDDEPRDNIPDAMTIAKARKEDAIW